MKRGFDLVVAGLAALALSPVMLVVALLVRLLLGSPVLFRQVRPGLHGRPFEMIKFRTMRDAVDQSGAPLADAERLTAFGRFLRSSSLDELPGLWNVITGDMSLVGPRPLLMEYLDLYSPEQARRHEVRPGLTGWAQVNGRNAIGWETKFEHDVWYVDNRSFRLDLKILALTVQKVLRRDGITSADSVTMEKFAGTPAHLRTLRLAIFGAGGHGRVVRDCAIAAGWRRVDVYDGDPARRGSGPGDAVGDLADLTASLDRYGGVVVAIGRAEARLPVQRELEAAGATLATLIHPHSSVSPSAEIGRGSVVLAGGVVNADARLGKGVIVNTGATVDHDCVLGDGAHVAPGAHLAGGVQVGEMTWVGVGAAVREYVTIGNRVCIGAGAVVVKSVPDDLTVVGNPARPMAKRP